MRNFYGIKIYRAIRKKIKNLYYRFLSDKIYLNLLFKKKYGRKIDFKNPKTFNEKLQFLKVKWRDETASKCADKYEARSYVEKKGLKYLLNDVIGVYNNVSEIKIEELPKQFIMKCTHGSGCNIICEDKETLDWKLAKKKLSKWLKTNYYWPSREWVYKKIRPKIICEKFLKPLNGVDLFDYKFMCFNGEPKLIFFCSDRKNAVKSDYYDLDWNQLDFRGEYPKSGVIHTKPTKLKEMIGYAKILADSFPFVRVDFYLVDNKVYFGELTFFHHGGFGRYYPPETDYKIGELLNLKGLI